MVQLVCIRAEDVWKIWPGRVSELIDAGFAANDVPMPHDILDQLRSGNRVLWLVVGDDSKILASMLTSLHQMRSGKTCKMLECGGDQLSLWSHLRAEIENYAKAEGCDTVLIEGRVGWSRLFRDYRTVAVVLEKRI